MRTTTAAAIRYHYDVSDDFYRLWLCQRMIYSAALWQSDDESLEQAQLNKLRHHLTQAGIRPGSRLLEIGCGWGGLLQLAAEEYGASAALGLTLSQTQAAGIRKLRDPRLQVVLESWETYREPGMFDAIVSIGAFEHFGRRDQSREERLATYVGFFEFCRRRLPEGGRLSMQTIAYGRMKRLPPFVQDRIWPESELPTAGEVLEAASGGHFEVESMFNHRLHYARTLAEWRRRLLAQSDAATMAVGEQKASDYLKYLDMSEKAFSSGGLQLLRITLRKPWR